MTDPLNFFEFYIPPGHTANLKTLQQIYKNTVLFDRVRCRVYLVWGSN